MSPTTDNLSAGTGSQLKGMTLTAFLALVMIGGSNAVAVRISNLELPPFWGAGIRFLAAAGIFWAIILIRRVALPTGRALLGSLLYGVLGIGTSYALLYWSLLNIRAGLAMIVLALGPLLTLLFSTTHRLEPFQWRSLSGALIALAGISLAVGQDLGTSVPLLSLLALVLGAASIAEASVVYKLFPRSDPLATNGIATTVGSIILILVSVAAGESWSFPTEPRTWAAYTYLVVLGSVVLFYLYLFVLTRWTATATSYAFLLFPVATVIIAAWLSDEPVTLHFVVGGFIVLFGVWVGALKQQSESPVEPERIEEIEFEGSAPPRPGCA